MGNLDLNLTPWQRVIFIFHLFIMVLAWVAPFLFSWYLVVPIYLLLIVQFAVFGRCLLNKAHNLEGERGSTLYVYVFDYLNIKVNRDKLNYFIHKPFYIILTVITLTWQLVLGFMPVLF